MSKDLLDFGGAIRALKEGRRVARVGWNGKGMWLALTRGNVIDPGDSWCDKMGLAKGSKIHMEPLITMKTAQDTLQVGWLASQADLLSEDWVVV